MKRILTVLLAILVGVAFAAAQQEKAPKVEKKKVVQVECANEGMGGCGAEGAGCGEKKGEKASVKPGQGKDQAGCCSEKGVVKGSKVSKAPKGLRPVSGGKGEK